MFAYLCSKYVLIFKSTGKAKSLVLIRAATLIKIIITHYDHLHIKYTNKIKKGEKIMKNNKNYNYLIQWVGGKRLLRKTIGAMIPADIESYTEPFGGEAWVLFYKDRWAELEVYSVRACTSNVFYACKQRTI